ncbi:MAG: ABC transporter ATP-binding protein [Pigmentiphaga sp.]|uniref:ABC transporter ATP-binding protein n=1 Tax=Pigmentiphaga sp. TaxID=1977564 RepID=UPI0029BE9CC7|nr:ABC transporter ATP-binding protein [Pigmentiphaga sp.]MDX3904705.1 ABC transporter ATP-binding protein [Pigmentiphaga sp.]
MTTHSSVAAAPAVINPASDPIIKALGISMCYPNGVTALENVSLDIPRGELVTLLGPSGCGKTTLLKIIAGLIEPTAGEIRANGKTVRGPGPDRAFVFQDFALMPWATVLRNVAFGLELRGTPREKREEIARHYIHEVGLAGFEDKYPNELSGGMRQRAGLARALSVDADVLLMDEPFSAIDEQMRRKLQEDLLSLLRVEKKTVIFVTHSIEEAVYLSDEIVLLTRHPGKVVKTVRPGMDRDASPDEIRRDRRYLDAVDDIWSQLKQYLL